MKPLAKILFPALGLLCFWPEVSSALALGLGIALALFCGNPYHEWTKRFTPRLLTWSVMGLGAGMNLNVVASNGLHGFAYTLAGISFTLGLGWVIGRLLGVAEETGILITVGTAICGGSAIAAIAPTIRAKPQSISVALGTVFILNALALLIFPPLGHWLSMGQTQFGLWSALAVHDTSSVVGCTLQYGAQALEVGTTVKLARALWIVPLTIATSFFYKNKRSESAQKPKRPWFILGFIAAAAVVTWIPQLVPAGQMLEAVAKRTLVLTLFLIGGNLTISTMRSVGFKPFVLGIILWILVATSTLLAVHYNLIT